MGKQIDSVMELMEGLGLKIIPEDFESETPEEEILYEWAELEGGGFNETK